METDYQAHRFHANYRSSIHISSLLFPWSGRIRLITTGDNMTISSDHILFSTLYTFKPHPLLIYVPVIHLTTRLPVPWHCLSVFFISDKQQLVEFPDNLRAKDSGVFCGTQRSHPDAFCSKSLSCRPNYEWDVQSIIAIHQSALQQSPGPLKYALHQ